MAPGRVHPDELASYWSAVTEGDVDSAYALFCDVVARGVPFGVVLDRLVAGTQQRVGDLWACHQWTVLQEHRATAVSEAVLDRLSATRPRRSRGPRVLVSCVDREWHTMASLLLAVELREAGVRVDYRGGDVDAVELARRIEVTRPRAVLLSASITSSLARVGPLIELCRDLRTPVLVGGAAFDRAGIRASRLGATAYAATAEEAVSRLRDLPVRTDPLPDLVPPRTVEARQVDLRSAELTRVVLDAVRARLDLADVALLPLDDWRVVLVTLVPHVVDSVTAALLTADSSVMTEMRAWLDEVLVPRGADPSCGAELWRALHLALAEHPLAQAMLAGRD